MANRDMVRVDAVVSGRVQGVSFRYYTMRRAQMLGIRGWVKNLPDGDVNVVIEGPKDKANEMLQWLKHGPNLANVKDLNYSFSEYTGEFASFEIKF